MVKIYIFFTNSSLLQYIQYNISGQIVLKYDVYLVSSVSLVCC